jgi:hypothetical protein
MQDAREVISLLSNASQFVEIEKGHASLTLERLWPDAALLRSGDCLGRGCTIVSIIQRHFDKDGRTACCEQDKELVRML